jgi:hypothetical protein
LDKVREGGSWEVIYPHLIRIQHTRQEGPAPESSKPVFNGAVDIEAAMLLIAPESSITCANFGNTVISL